MRLKIFALLLVLLFSTFCFGQWPLTGCPTAAMAPGQMPDYMSGCVGNYANSPLPIVDPNTGAVSGGMRKFVDSLPLLNTPNNLGQMLPVAVPDTITYPGSDYYEIKLVQYSEQMHSDLPPTLLRGYVQTNYGTDPNTGQNSISPASVHYLGPLILAQKDRPVRIKFTNALPTGAGGDLFIPVDTTVMGSGMAPDGSMYPQNRANIHLHGGNTPWISDGTPHQWTTPAGESTAYPKGVSVRNVPDMPDPGDGSMTLFYTNQQSARLMFYHDHAYGITRLNVYAGAAAGYLISDPQEQNLVTKGILPPDQIPLIIQDKTFLPPPVQLAAQDPTWNWGPKDLTTDPTGNTFFKGNLWFPHVYMPNQNPYDDSGANMMGRWDWGPWFWPPMDPSTLVSGEVPCPTGLNPQQMCPGTPNPSLVPEAFMDTPVINGTAYPFTNVDRKPYRLRILNAANDRTFNLGLYCADSTVTSADGRSNTEVKTVTAPDGIAAQGPIPDPTTAGPSMIQIGTEGGFLPAPVVIPPTPVSYNYNRRDIVVLNIQGHGLLLGPAERADVIVDFSQAPAGCSNIILYNDAPAPVPAFDTRYDYYTGDPDQSDTGGAPRTIVGYGPNTRTLMQFRLSSGGGASFDLAALQGAFASSATAAGAYALSQPAPLVPESAYGTGSANTQAFNQAYTNTYSRIQSTSLTFTPLNPDGSPQLDPQTGLPISKTQPLLRKTIQELFELEYGRMNATLGVELPLTNFTTQTTIPYFYADPPTELMKDGETQIWKITHNGVDTHAIHFHLFNVQLLNRVGWDGAIRPPDANELGWKETVRMNPLEDAIVALQPLKQTLPWPIPDSVRPLSPSMPLNATSRTMFTNVDPTGAGVTTTNDIVNFGQEYVWHCHLLGHEENDMMRPIIFQVNPETPTSLIAGTSSDGVVLSFTDNSASETGFTLQRDIDPAFPSPTSFDVAPSTPNSTFGNTISFTDTTGATGQFYYRVRSANNSATLNAWTNTTQTLVSDWSNTATVSAIPIIVATPKSISFADQAVNTSSAPQTITISNTGTAQLTITNVVVSGTNSNDFSVSTTCANVTTGSNCTIAVTFTPTAEGPRTASVAISSNDPSNPTLNVALSGTGLSSIAAVSPASLSFGSQTLNATSAAKTFNLVNTGNATLTVNSISISGANASEFAQTNNCGTSVAANVGSCTISVTFTPKSLGTRNASAVVSTNDPLNPNLTVALDGTGTAGVIGVSPTSVTFANQLVKTTSQPQTLTLSNTGNTALSVLGISFTGTNTSDFAQTNTCGTSVGAGASCIINVTFTPAAAGARSASIVVASNDPVTPQLTAAISGTGVAPTINVNPLSIAFGNQLTNTASAAQVIAVSNTGTADLAISGITLTGANAADFSRTAGVNDCGATLAVNASCNISIVYKPTVTGPSTAALAISSSDPVTPSLSVPLSGTGVAPKANLAPAALTFANQLAKTTSAAQSVTLTNSGTSPLIINSISLAGTNAADFTRTTTCTGSLGAGNSCSISITFTPTINGTESASLSVSTSDQTNPTLAVAITGTGIAPVANVSPTSLIYPAQVVVTTSVPLPLTLFNSGTAPLIINSIAISGVNAGDFSTSSTCPAGGNGVAIGGSCTITVSFKPTASGARSATLSIATSDPFHPTLTVPLSGIGTTVALSPTAVDFGTQVLGTTSASRTITLTNTGSTNLTVNSITLTGLNPGDFTMSNACVGTLRAGRSCSINVRFAPTSSGARSATMTVNSSDVGNPNATVLLTGNGALGPAVALSPTSLNFGNVTQRTTSAPQSVTLTNTGGSSLTISSIALGGNNSGDFAQTNNCGTTVVAGASCTINVTFTPTRRSLRTATLSINDNAPGTPQTVQLSGTGQ